jgi:hypothetical protein
MDDTGMMPLNDKMDRWRNHPDSPDHCVSRDVEDKPDRDFPPSQSMENQQDEDSASDMPDYHTYVVQDPAYQWLLGSLRRELYLTPAEPNTMEAIRQKIIDSLPTSYKISRNRPAEVHQITLQIRWDPRAFIKEQGYAANFEDAIEMAITLTGSAGDAQALSCGQYLCHTWPFTGQHIMHLVRAVMRSEDGHQQTCKNLNKEEKRN